MRPALELDALPGRIEKPDLPVAADERSAREIAHAHCRSRRDGTPGGDRSGLPLDRHRL